MSFVLIVEPEEVNAARIRAILESLDFDFRYELVMSAEEAIMVVENQKPDVFIGDMQIPVMSGAELFSMVEMMSPDTVRIVMTDGGRIQETVAFMNECRIFKIIIKPCRVADDLLVPIRAALQYKEQCEICRQKVQATDASRTSVEEAFEQTEVLWRKQMNEIKRARDAMIQLTTTNVDVDSAMEEKVKERVKRWYQWMLEEYVHQVINGSGNYEQFVRSQLSFGHEPEKRCIFQMKNSVSTPIPQNHLNEIAYILRLVTGACKDLQNYYHLQALIEETDTAYILRVRYLTVKDENGVELPRAQRVKSPEIRNGIIRATKIAIAAMGAKSAEIQKDGERMINIAVPK